ncbi:MAG: cytidine deaminase [Sandaracinaceae bacterium]
MNEEDTIDADGLPALDADAIDEPAIDWSALEAEARAARERAYAPYSRYAVGAALLGADGKTYRGANIENASYGLCLCAERSALANALTAGVHEFAALVVLTKGPVPAAPCGMCRQVLSEFSRRLPIRCVTDAGARLDTSIEELLPHAFDRGYLEGDGG